MNIFVLILCIGVGWVCSQTSNVHEKLNIEYKKQSSQIERLISVLEDWKEKDTNNHFREVK